MKGTTFFRGIGIGGNLKKTKKKTEREILDKDCLDLWSLCVRKKDGTCRNCNGDTHLSGHHIRVKQHRATRYDVINNGMCLCSKCHSLQKFQPERFHDMVISIIGQAEYDRIKAISQIVTKYSLDDLREIKRDLQRKLDGGFFE